MTSPEPVDSPTATFTPPVYTAAQYPAEPVPPTQVKHPWRTTLRTFIQNLPTIAVVIAAVTQAAQDQHVGWVEVWGPSAIAVSVLITRVMAIPAVNDLLTKIGVGAAPAA